MPRARPARRRRRARRAGPRAHRRTSRRHRTRRGAREARHEEEHLHVERPGLRLGHERDVDGSGDRSIAVAGEGDRRDAAGLAVLDRPQAVVGRAGDGGEDRDRVAAERGVARLDELGGDHAAHRQGRAAAGEVLVRPHGGVRAAGPDEEEVGEPLAVQAVDDLLDLPAQGDGAGGLRAEYLLVEAEHGGREHGGPFEAGDRSGIAFWYRYQVAIMLTHDGGVVNNR